jgi:hypothetical protein
MERVEKHQRKRRIIGERNKIKPIQTKQLQFNQNNFNLTPNRRTKHKRIDREKTNQIEEIEKVVSEERNH